MVNKNIYEDIIKRTDGDIYIGVVGPVRTGKSTFIKNFMEKAVLPVIEDAGVKRRAIDEMPQSAGGKTVMTTEPKFVPEKAIRVSLSDNSFCNMKLIDCVGYIVSEAQGIFEGGEERLVNTPWSKEPMPFNKAAELGTKKVICDHATIGIVITTDASFSDIPRSNYLEAEDRVIREMKRSKKPFIILVNSSEPSGALPKAIAAELSEKYSVPAMSVSCETMDTQDITRILEKILFEFPVREIGFLMPAWVERLSENHSLKNEIGEKIFTFGKNVKRVGDISPSIETFSEGGEVVGARLAENDLGTGVARIELLLEDGLFYKVLGESTGFEISGEEALVTIMGELFEIKKKYDRVESALKDAEERGYGIVTPEICDLRLDTPEIVKQPGGYGVKLKASAPSIHMIKADIKTEVSPIVGSERQSEDMVKFLLKEFEEDPQKIWESNMFGKSLHELVNEGLNTKLEHMPGDAREKLGETLQRIINEGSNGLICIIL